ncbi:hypothetical protein PQU92_00780 [Asticcacaulis sp. BYS171W]|uniref:Serine protease n=1 Tax=Asticcacaulis aquaticus TaxID=2984212 RepID=A0ABT5HP17_9CAUL|nr:hypothetical protein [Asticcacaulis aquaticus]MDC7681792.1 hypothetical protein [Asticcacaulis aquaticus]
MEDSANKSKFSAGFHKYVTSGKILRDQPKIDMTTLASVSLEMMFNSTVLAVGTGFFWRVAGGISLVTAWHNLSGMHHTKRVYMRRDGGFPNFIKIKYTSKVPQIFQEQTIPLYFDDEMSQPRWFVHPTCGNFFDVAALLLIFNDHDVVCVNDLCENTTEHILPGSDVFAIGFPQGISSLGVIPVWKRGSLATEIDLPTDAHPKFLIDLAGRGGLSGAPVYRIQRGVVIDQINGNRQFGLGNKTEFLGLYSGRAADQLPPETRTGESSDLGFVWRSEIIAEVVASTEIDEKPEIGKGELTVTPIWENMSADAMKAVKQNATYSFGREVAGHVAAGIYGQGELATMNFSDIKDRLEKDKM